jgi:GNAT superfamily N-acetyltransferase
VTTEPASAPTLTDLATTEAARSHGHGAALLAALTDRARDLGCHAIDLDSGVQRSGAHRFYLRERFTINAFHFTKPL